MTITVEALAKRVQELEDLNAIKDLKHRYLRACDRQRPDDVRECFDPDGVVIEFDGFPRFEDRDAFVKTYAELGCRPGVIDMHHGENPDIQLTGANTAKGKWDLFFYNIDMNARTALQMSCEYNDEYVKKNGRWFIKKTTTKRYSFLMQSVAENGAPTVMALGKPPEMMFGQAPAAAKS